MALFRRSVRPPASASPRPDKRQHLPPEEDLTIREKVWASLGALLPFIPENPATQAKIEHGIVRGLGFGRRYVLPPGLALALVVTSAVPAQATDAPAAAQRMLKWFMSEFPRDASTWITAHSNEISSAARAYKQYATAMRLYERVARARDIGFTLTFELPPVRLADDLGTGNSYDDVVIRPAGAPDLMLQKMNPKNFAVNFDFSGLKNQLNGLLMGKWDVDYSRVTVGPDGKKTVTKDPAEIAALAKMTAVSTWLLGNHKINPFPSYVDAGEDTRVKYDQVSKDLATSWRRRLSLRDKVQARLLQNIQALESKGADATALRNELTTLLVSRALDEAITADPSSPTGTTLGDAKLKTLKNLDSQGLAAMELMASNRFRMEMVGQNQAATADAVGYASQQYNAKNDLSSLVGDVYDLTAKSAEMFGLSWSHQTAPGAATAATVGWAQVGKALGDAVKASQPQNANREQIGNQLKSNAYLSGQEQHLAELLRAVTETNIDNQNDKVQAILQARTEKLAQVTGAALEMDVEERSQSAVDKYAQGLDSKPRVVGLRINRKERKLIPDDPSQLVAPSDLMALITPADEDYMNIVVEGDEAAPDQMDQSIKDAKGQVIDEYKKHAVDEIKKIPSVFEKTVSNVNWKGYLGFLDPVIQALNKGISTILGHTFNLGDSNTYEKLKAKESIDMSA